MLRVVPNLVYIYFFLNNKKKTQKTLFPKIVLTIDADNFDCNDGVMMILRMRVMVLVVGIMK